jgi:hypothetical protein
MLSRTKRQLFDFSIHAVRTRKIVNRVAGIAQLWVGVFCSALCASCGGGQSSSAASSAGARSHADIANMLCFTSADTRKVVVSSVFPVKTYPPERMIEEPWAKDFRRYIGQSGNAGGISVTCSQASSDDAARRKVEELRKQGHEVVETQWSYAGG